MTEPEMREYLAERLKGVSADTIGPMIREVMAMPHDYGTVCVAIAALAAAAARAADQEPNGGITGFQASAVFWEFVRLWNPGLASADAPMRLVNYEDMLFPQYDRKFAPTISPHTADWLAQQARIKLETEIRDNVHPAVWAHWEQVASGAIPFGYAVAND